MWFFKNKNKCKHYYELIKIGDISKEIKTEDIKMLLEVILDNNKSNEITELFYGKSNNHITFQPTEIEQLIKIIKEQLTHITGIYYVTKCKHCNHIEVNTIYFN